MQKKSLHTIVAVAIGVLLPFTKPFALELDTGGKTEAELNAETVVRCQYQMGEFGNEAINICVKSDREAREQLAEYPDEVADIVRRCNRVMHKAGWSMIKTCSDRDIAARDALQGYDDQHAETIEACRASEGRYGYAAVQKCVDAQIPGE
jgi:hypothetical protein